MTTLIAFDDNPGPAPRMDGYVTTPDGFDLRYAMFRSPVRPNKGTVILLQGRNECIEKYLETIDDVMKLGFDVCTFDWRGQGRSTRFLADPKRGYVDDFAQYVADLDCVFTEAFLAETRSPFYLLAHSMGALIALLAAPIMSNRIERMVLSAPFLGVTEEGPPAPILAGATATLRYIGLGRSYLGAGSAGITALDLATNKLTTDARRFARNQRMLDPDGGLGLGGPTAGWLSAAFAAFRRVRDPAHMMRVQVPTLMVVAGADRVVSIPATEAYAHRLRSATLIKITGARHELMQEADLFREQFMAAFSVFVPGSRD